MSRRRFDANVRIPMTDWQAFVAFAWSWSVDGKKDLQIGVEPRNEHDWRTVSFSVGRWFGFGFSETYYDGPWSWFDLGLVSVFFGGRPLPRWAKAIARRNDEPL